MKISLPQLAASVLASVTAAVIASFFGVAGTLVGTALASLITTLGSAVYLSSYHSTREAARRTRQHRAAGNTGQHKGQEPASGMDALAKLRPPGPATAAGAGRSTGGRHLARSSTPKGSERRRRPWLVAAGSVVLVFLVTLGVVTAIEAGARAPLATLVGASRTAPGSTSVGGLFGGQTAPSSPTPATTTTVPAGPPPPPTSTTTVTTTTTTSTSTTVSSPGGGAPGGAARPPTSGG
ncbi:MAG TPA: hypothetical protein VE152_03300 [Acidimicrobiales bacterium]|jgi:hypothetical protein|nr:hypothetical protein [Acidimicrobiales bacterium]